DAIAAGVILARRFPKRFALRAAQRHKIGIAVMVAVYHDLVLEQYRRAAKAVHARKRSGPDQPFLVSVEIVSRHHHFLPVKKGDVNLPAIRRRRARRVAVQRMFFLQGRLEHGLVPENFSALSVETEQHALLLLKKSAHGKEPVTPHNRRGMAVTGNFSFPDYVADRKSTRLNSSHVAIS